MVEAATVPICRYVVEHFETELSDWTLSEYIHMLLILGNLYRDPVVQRQGDANGTKTQLIITNFNFVDRFNKETLKEDELHTKRNTERFIKIRNALEAG